MKDNSKLKFLKDYENVAQNEALLNEIKGALFEYFLAASLARHFDLTGDFLLKISESDRGRLQQYEDWMREANTPLLENLVKMAQIISQKILNDPYFSTGIKSIYWSGESSYQVNEGEGDIILELASQKISLSLKMCKLHSFVNTKSAGLKSVFKTYFSHFSQAEFLQLDLNNEVETSYAILGQELYESEGLGDFSGKFDEEWTQSHLPGKLPSHLQKILYQHYYRVSLKLQHLFKTLHQQSGEQFLLGLWALCGLSRPDLWQIIWQYQSQELPTGLLAILNRERLLLNDHHLKMGEVTIDGASFSLHFTGGELQIRVKPMNVFTTPAMKINCAIRYQSQLFDPM